MMRVLRTMNPRGRRFDTSHSTHSPREAPQTADGKAGGRDAKQSDRRREHEHATVRIARCGMHGEQQQKECRRHKAERDRQQPIRPAPDRVEEHTLYGGTSGHAVQLRARVPTVQAKALTVTASAVTQLVIAWLSAVHVGGAGQAGAWWPARMRRRS